MAESMYWKISTALLAVAVVGLLIVIGSFVFSNDSSEDLNGKIEIKANFSELIQENKTFGIFSEKPTWNSNIEGRKSGGDLEDTAVILESSSLSNTRRWLNGIKKQRKSWQQDLPVYVYPADLTNSTHYFELKKLRDQYQNVFVVKPNTNNSIVSDVLKRPQIQFLIEVDDVEHMGADFADYYYLGRKVLKADGLIRCICGGNENQQNEYFQPAAGDIFWLMENGNECEIGPMHRRAYFDEDYKEPGVDDVCVRPEVGRVSEKEQESQVTKMSWHVSRFDPQILTRKSFFKRIEKDLLKAKALQKVEWEDLKRMDEDEIYMFPFDDEDDLAHYFEVENVMDMLDQKKYGDVIPLFFDGRKVYIVSTNVYDNIINNQTLIGDGFLPGESAVNLEK